MSARLLTVIRNPSARRRLRLSRLAAALEKLERRGWRVECRTTAHIGHATALAALAAQRGSEAVLVCGGDGTINEAVNGLAGSETALAVLPAGTINLWAREVGLSADPAAAVRLMLSGERRRVDLGRVGDRYFLMLASVGVDAVAVRAVMAERKRRWGRYAYLAAGVSDLLRHGGRPLAIEAGEVHFRGRALAAIVGNTRLYAGLLHAAHRARIDDGLLDLRVYAGGARPDRGGAAAAGAGGRRTHWHDADDLLGRAACPDGDRAPRPGLAAVHADAAAARRRTAARLGRAAGRDGARRPRPGAAAVHAGAATQRRSAAAGRGAEWRRRRQLSRRR